MTETAPPDEYVLARSVLLDALEALEPQIESLVLVGAQAIYLHTGPDTTTGVANTTTDADVALDTALISADPEFTRALEDAGFTSGKNPGSWLGKGQVAIDIMVPPHLAGDVRKSARGAALPEPHGKRTARITAGLEATLVDHSPMLIHALVDGDERSFTLKVAGPAALLAAKAVKIAERAADVEAGKRDRLRTKDAVDVLRLLREIETEDLIAGLRKHTLEPHAHAVSTQALEFLATQLDRGEDDVVRSLITDELDETDPSASISYQGLMAALIDAARDEGLLPA